MFEKIETPPIENFPVVSDGSTSLKVVMNFLCVSIFHNSFLLLAKAAVYVTGTNTADCLGSQQALARFPCNKQKRK